METTKSGVVDAVANNPATSTASVGAAVVIIGRLFGWSDPVTADIATLALLAVPFVRGFGPLATKIKEWWKK